MGVVFRITANCEVPFLFFTRRDRGSLPRLTTFHDEIYLLLLIA